MHSVLTPGTGYLGSLGAHARIALQAHLHCCPFGRCTHTPVHPHSPSATAVEIRTQCTGCFESKEEAPEALRFSLAIDMWKRQCVSDCSFVAGRGGKLTSKAVHI